MDELLIWKCAAMFFGSAFVSCVVTFVLGMWMQRR